ncbi:MAG: outer membrane beta-barrel protein [Flavobacteriales bacterium]|mgnify:CR=1 FL=1|nr:outer membrane beta-barrel protein [Flavobacteriales bacterium]
MKLLLRYSILLLLGLVIFSDGVMAQKRIRGQKNLAYFDSKPYHFGFLLSWNTSSFFLDLKPDYTFNDSLLSVANVPQAGFNLGMLASLNLNKNVSFRFIPTLSFQDRGLEYRFHKADGGTQTFLKRTESVWLEFPLILKLRTNRVGNFAAYALVGGKYGLDMQTQKDVNNDVASDIIIKLQDRDYSIDAGGGFDFFLEYFKFAIEMKTAFGLPDVLLHEDHQFSAPLSKLRTRTFIFSISFEG